MKTFSSFSKLGLAAIVAFATLSPAASTAQTFTATNSIHIYECKKSQYKNSAGKCVSSPKKAEGWPAGSSAKCGDGTYSFSQNRKGTCSRHGGVSVWR